MVPLLVFVLVVVVKTVSQAVFGNCENLVITMERGLVEGFLGEFRRLWEGGPAVGGLRGVGS